MTPEQITALAALLSAIGTWPTITVVAMVTIGPWVAMIILSARQSREISRMVTKSSEKFDAVVEMYKNNVELVRSYERQYDALTRINEDAHDSINLNTKILTQLSERIATNMFCPPLRAQQPNPRTSGQEG